MIFFKDGDNSATQKNISQIQAKINPCIGFKKHTRP